MAKEPWEISTVTMLSALKKEPLVKGVVLSDLKYTVLDNHAVAYRDAQELAEVHSIDKAIAPKEYVAFRPERLALHESIVSVSTRLQLNDESHMQAVSMQVYQSVLRELPTLGLDQVRNSITNEVSRLVDAHLDGEDINQQPMGTAIAQLCEKAKNHENFGQFKTGYTLREAVIARMTDIQFTSIASERIKPLIESHLPQNVPPLKIPPQDQRLTMMITGGPASGKGSSVVKLQSYAKSEGISWTNVIKINTDSYKPLLLTPGTVKNELYSQLAQEEASVVHQKIQQRLNHMAETRSAPHTFIDQVFLGADKIDYGLRNGGKVRGIIVSTDVSDAIQRSYSRGAEEGRFEDTKGILRCHKLMTVQTPITLAKFVGQDVQLQLVDNNVERGVHAQRVADFDLNARSGVVYSEPMLMRFAAKTQINVDATSEQDLYASKTQIRDYLLPLQTAGCDIRVTPEPQEAIQNVQDQEAVQNIQNNVKLSSS